MTRHIAVRLALVALTTVLPISSVASSPAPNAPAQQTLPKTKGGVKMTLKNNSASVRTLRVGDTSVTLQPKEELAIQVPANTVIYAVGDTPSHKDGDKILTVSKDMSGITCSMS